jgi:hypothetical protein
MDNVYFDLTKCSEYSLSIPLYLLAGSITNLCSKIRSPDPSRYVITVSSLQQDTVQDLDAIKVSFNWDKPPIFTCVTKQSNSHQQTWKFDGLVNSELNRAVYNGTGFFTGKPNDRGELTLVLVGTRIFRKVNGILLPVPWTGNSARNLGI